MASNYSNTDTIVSKVCSDEKPIKELVEEKMVKELGEKKMVKELGEKKMVIHMKIAAHQLLSKLLRPDNPEHDWESLAGLMGFSYEEILHLRCDVDPVISIIRQWERQLDATIDKLLSFLNKIGRLDVIEDLQPYISETPLPTEYQKRRSKVLENYNQSPAVGKLPIELERLTVSDEIFDGFICYAKEDRSFAHEILTTLEASPYYRKICIDFRDYVPGNCRFDQTAKIIEHRCKHLVAVMSPNFTNSPDAGFQVRIALNLSPDFDKRRVIPILYHECEIPEILKPIYHLNYQDSSERIYFWKRLAASLGYVDQEKPRGSPLIAKKAPGSPRESPQGSPRTEKKSNQSIIFNKSEKKSKNRFTGILRLKK